MIKRAALAAAGLAVGVGVAAGVSEAAVGPVSQLTTAHVSEAEPLRKPKELATATPAPERPAPTAAATPTDAAPVEAAPEEVPLAEATAEPPAEPEVPAEEPAGAPASEPTAVEADAAPAPQPSPAPEPAPAPAPAPEAPGGGTPAATQGGFDQRMVTLINAERQAAGVAPLQYWGGLRSGALAHSSWMDGNDFQHASDATMDADTAAASCSGGWAENIYWASDTGTSPEAAMAAYMDSPGHRANILHPDLRFVATGTVATDGGLFNTQRFSFTCG